MFHTLIFLALIVSVCSSAAWMVAFGLLLLSRRGLTVGVH